MEDSMEDSRQRAKKFSDAEKLALSEAVKDRHGILFGKLDNNVTRREKNGAWREVLETVNAVGGYNRSLQQIQEKFKNMKKEVKTIAVKNNKEIRKTGGGTADIQDMDETSQNILCTIPSTSIRGIQGGIDTSHNSGRGTVVTRLEDSSSHLTSGAIRGKIDTSHNADRGTVSTRLDDSSLHLHSSMTVSLAELPPPKSVPKARELPQIQDDFASTNSTDEIPSRASASTTNATVLNSQRTPKRLRDLRPPTEVLLKRQVELVEEQVKWTKGIYCLMQERNQIEKERNEMLAEENRLKKRKLEILELKLQRNQIVPRLQLHTTVD